MLSLAPKVIAHRFTADRSVAVAVSIVAMSVLTGMSAQWEVVLPFTPVPLTLQTGVVLLSGSFLGSRAGGASQILYVLLGAFGLPFFAGGTSGIAVLQGPTVGYLLGFVLAAAVVGRLAERGADRRLRTAVPAYLLATSVIYVPGVMGLMAVADLGFRQAVAAGVLPFLLGDVLKALLAALGVSGTWVILGRR